MNIQLEAFNYLDYIFQKSAGFKALLCDPETLKFISVAMTKTELFKLEVLIIDKLPSFIHHPKNSEFDTFTCICILRPTSENINLICNELGNPHFPRYSLFFTNMISDEQIRQLASSDSQSLIQDCQEVYIDYSALGTRLFSLNLCDISDFRKNTSLLSYSDRIVEGLYALVCSLKVKPIIRYDCNSIVTQKIASRLSECIQTNVEFFGSHHIDNALVLILDRRNDPVTPLLHCFYYYSILHDLFTIDNNVIKVGKNEFPIDERTDPHAEKLGIMYLSQAGNAIYEIVQYIINTTKEMENVKMSEMNETMLKYIECTAQKTYSHNNNELFLNITEKIKREDLMAITQLEQIIASSTNAEYQYNELEKLVNSSNCTPEYALRLALLFNLHYQKSNPNLVSKVMNLLQNKCQWPGNEMRYSNTLLNIAGYDQRIDPIFPKETFITKIKNNIGFNDSETFQMFHPPLEQIIQNIKNKKLDTDKYPYIGNKKGQPQKVIIFYVGGATYMEHVIASANSNQSYQFIIGGTTIHNADSFLKYEVDPFC